MLRITPDDVCIDRILPFVREVPFPFIQSEGWQSKAGELAQMISALDGPALTTVVLVLLSFAFHAGWAARDLRSQAGNS